MMSTSFNQYESNMKININEIYLIFYQSIHRTESHLLYAYLPEEMMNLGITKNAVEGMKIISILYQHNFIWQQKDFFCTRFT